jgi:transglutaminase-like putative cysteine protease
VSPADRTRRLDVTRPSPAIRTLAERIVAGAVTRRERALACFRFVRDEIRFGFAPRFDLATPEETLASGVGHCNPQATLFASLLCAVDVEARLHAVTITREILDGIFPDRAAPPERLAHTFTEVRLDGDWVPVDGYIVDPRLRAAALPRLHRRGRTLGFGVHVDGSDEWDGATRCMSQFVSDAMRAGPDHGTFADAHGFFSSDRNPQRLGVLTGLLYRTFAVGPANRALDRVRDGHAA